MSLLSYNRAPPEPFALPRASGWLRRSLGVLPAELSTLRLGYTGAIRGCAPPFPGMSIWQTGRVFTPLLPAPSPARDVPGQPCSSRRDMVRGIMLDQTQLLPSLLQGNLSRLPSWPAFSGLGKVSLLWFHHRALSLFNLATPKKALIGASPTALEVATVAMQVANKYSVRFISHLLEGCGCCTQGKESSWQNLSRQDSPETQTLLRQSH